ncbi:splicing factor 3A subunit 2-like [Morus notabilis]|uniref:splicing factor 3A subunit 2-like n=1 Tax=Morus notabilis TaxID=981085 RepID=UPI000CED0F2E|nr:splicing factor 3A subunit 2-like [Morus notabilis]
MRNHLECYECKLCWTLDNNEGNYLAHTQGKRHPTNLAKRAAREAKEAPARPQPHKHKVHIRKIVYTFVAGMSNQERAFRLNCGDDFFIEAFCQDGRIYFTVSFN